MLDRSPARAAARVLPGPAREALDRGVGGARPTTSAACGWTATTRSGSSCTRTCCGCSAASAEERVSTAPLASSARRPASCPDREEVGGKARSLATMRSLGLPVPPAFVLTTARRQALLARRACPTACGPTCWPRIAQLEEAHGPEVRCAATAAGLRALRRGAEHARDDGHDPQPRHRPTASRRRSPRRAGTRRSPRDTHSALRGESYAARRRRTTPRPTRTEQLRAAICAVFASWHSPRARGLPQPPRHRRRRRHRRHRAGDGLRQPRRPLRHRRAVHPQPADRRPARRTGEFLPRGQGEDVVSGEVDPLRPLADSPTGCPRCTPRCSTRAARSSATRRDVQDIEFTVERGRLYLLQTRPAKRSARRRGAARRRPRRRGRDHPGRGAGPHPARARRDACCGPCSTPRPARGATVLARGEPACPGIGVGPAPSPTRTRPLRRRRRGRRPGAPRHRAPTTCTA